MRGSQYAPPKKLTLLLQEIQIVFGFTFLVPAHPGSPGQNPEIRKTVAVVVVVITTGVVQSAAFFVKFLAFIWRD